MCIGGFRIKLLSFFGTNHHYALLQEDIERIQRKIHAFFFFNYFISSLFLKIDDI
jgi:hypothetical protein